jgi:flagellar hook-length control protein FliK
MMGSAAATSLGVMPGNSATAVQGDAPAADSGNGFLAALGAVGPASAASTQPAVKSPPATTEETTSGETEVTELAALIAAMLQSTPPVASEAMADGNPDIEVAAQESAESTRDALLASVRAAVTKLAAGAAADADADADVEASADAIVGDGAKLLQALAVKSQADGASPAPPVQIGLRQLLQMMGQQPAEQGNTELAPTPATANLPEAAAAAPVVKLAQGAAEFAQAMSASATAHGNDQPAPVQPAPSAPDSMLAAASANFASPVHQPVPASADPAPTLHAAVGTARWADELGSRLTLMTLRGQHEGSLNLTPDHLGPVEVRISVNQNTANVWFGAQHADTRAAITEAMPRLRELLGDAGLMLGQSGVSQQAPRHGSRSGEAHRNGVDAASNVADAATATPAIARRIALGLVDTYV